MLESVKIQAPKYAYRMCHVKDKQQLARYHTASLVDMADMLNPDLCKPSGG